MNQTMMAHVQHSWQRVIPMGADAGKLFYQHLFTADPELRPLFKGDIEQQAAKLVQMIDVAVSKLNDLSVLLPVLEHLGRRHRSYGVLPAHYHTVGAALLLTVDLGARLRRRMDARSKYRLGTLPPFKEI
jgi:hemoglobin-like flavoprotein